MATTQNTAVTALETKPASAFNGQQLADLFNRAFAGYVGTPISHTAESVVRSLEVNYVSLEESFIYSVPSEKEGEESEPVAFVMIALRDDKEEGGDGSAGKKERHARLMGMGVVPKYQGRKVGGLALRMAIQDVRARGLDVLELECICSNERGVRLYRSAGFEIIRELAGWERLNAEEAAPSTTTEAGGKLEECAVQEVVDLVRLHGAPDLAWQASLFDRSMTPQRAFHIGGEAYCVLTAPSEDNPWDEDKEGTVYNVTSVFVRPEHRGKGAAVRLAGAMSRRFPRWRWQTRVIFPVEYGEKIAERSGFKERSARLYQMRLRLQE